MKTKGSEVFDVTVGKDWRSGSLFLLDALSSQMFDWQNAHKASLQDLVGLDYGSIDSWICHILELKPYKRFRVKLHVELVKEVEKSKFGDDKK